MKGEGLLKKCQDWGESIFLRTVLELEVTRCTRIGSDPGALELEVTAHFWLVQMPTFQNKAVFLWNYPFRSGKRVEHVVCSLRICFKSISVFAVGRENFPRHQHMAVVLLPVLVSVFLKSISSLHSRGTTVLSISFL